MHIMLGRFHNFDEAVVIRKREEEQLWGEFFERLNESHTEIKQ